MPSTTSFDAFIDAAWNDHGDRPQEVADRLVGSLPIIETPEQIPPFSRLVTHVFGEHLGQWANGVSILASLRALPAFDGSPSLAGAIDRGIAVLRYADGDMASLQGLTDDNRIAALATASSVFAARTDFARAIGAYAEALRLADTGLPTGSPAARALAVGGNNLAAALEEKAGRDSGQTAAMVTAARSALKYWRLAGTWLEEARAEYRLACSLLQAGEPGPAAASARRCIALCEANAADAADQFQGRAALARALRAVGDVAGSKASADHALQWFDRMAPDVRPWFESERSTLVNAP